MIGKTNAVARKILISISAVAVCACSASRPFPTTSQSDAVAFVGGQIFDGEQFTQRKICVAERHFVACPKTPADEVSLDGLFVTPPFGDAHTHHFDGPFTIDWHTNLAIGSGVFYAMTMTARGSQVALVRERLRGPGNVDVSSSMGGITGPDSHPTEIYEAIALGAYTFEDQLARMDEIRASTLVADDAYFVVETENDLQEKWPLLLQSQPDHVKVYLRSSIEDFRASLDAEADMITHLPCYQDSSSEDAGPYFDIDTAEECLISKEDARRAANQQMVSTLIVTEWAKERPDEQVEWEKANITSLRAAGAPLAVGTNAYGMTLTDGMIAGVNKRFLPAVDLLRLASMHTPRAIFPSRNIGCLDIGCEASFIALERNPIEDISAIASIAVRLKDGELMELAE